ncbi:hypothetical protein NLM31_09005 [Bradyrhizobium sp. CCGUVB4N]|uniref:hypothetical protein n=1 Tax=Bradyrhizobium sp. CCGUVB4N TaxID=2949631 RepID=UPI0020B1E6CB|nr:hypothetical protein [Bradyrhizobium sp. CCGUVB4N]MCP3380495.1 hypothetical protein [Bradyrhizobium sp. CCGUVB4N]
MRIRSSQRPNRGLTSLMLAHQDPREGTGWDKHTFVAVVAIVLSVVIGLMMLPMRSFVGQREVAIAL